MLWFERLAKYIPMFESRKAISEELVARVGEKISSYRDLVGKRDAKSHLEDSVVDGRIVLNCIIKKQDGITECIYLIQDRDRGTDSCKHRGERLGTIKFRGISWVYEKWLASDEMSELLH
jgi:hypothetical protein